MTKNINEIIHQLPADRRQKIEQRTQELITEIMVQEDDDQSHSLSTTNIEIPVSMLDEVKAIAEELNIHPSAVIKMMLRRSLDEHYLASANKMA